MMPSRSTPNLQGTHDPKSNHPLSFYTYQHEQPGINFGSETVLPIRDAESPPPAPPVRDSSSLKYIKYGPGHEKFPSWPVPTASEIPESIRVPNSGGSHRSKSWTDHTDYPKEKVVNYTRPYMKRQHSSLQKKLKTVMEKCEKIPPDAYASHVADIKERLYLPRVDREGKPLGDMEYMVPSPPERDNNKPHLTQADLEEYVRSYEEQHYAKMHLTQAELEEYSRAYHQKQPSYAQSEGYHSYVSSTDSTSTPFLDRLRRDSEAVSNRAQAGPGTWDEATVRHEGRDSVVTNSSESASSSETLKWHGSMSDVSVASSSCTHPANSSISRQLIVHSAKVQTPQKHNSESVLYIGSDKKGSPGWKDQEKRNNNTNKLRLFAVNTYTVQPSQLQQEQNERLTSLSLPQSLSVADRINVLEMQHKYSYLDPDKRHRIPDPTLKAIQKKALLSFYERHQTNSWRSEPQLTGSHPSLTPVPQPPPRVKIQSPSRRASCASDYASGSNSRRSSFSSRDSRPDSKLVIRHHHSNSCGSLSTDLLGPIIVGPSISVDDWVPEKPPERPPKNPHLRTAFPDLFQMQRLPSPDLPPPSPPTVLEDEVLNNDEPLPPPPPELDDISKQYAEPQVECKKPIQKFFQERTSLHYPLQLNSSIVASQKVVNGISHQYRAEPLRINSRDEVRGNQRTSIAESPNRDVPPPLQPRQMRINQSMRARMPTDKRPFDLMKVQTLKGDRQDLGSKSLGYTMSHSKASYLQSRRDRERIVPDSDTGVYKRTMSPNGHSLPPETLPDASKIRETKWPVNRTNSDNILMRRVSMTEKSKNGTNLSLNSEGVTKKQPLLVLPDVLPVKEKLLPHRSQFAIRSISLDEERRFPPKYTSPPSSPPKSPFSPLRHSVLSSPLKPPPAFEPPPSCPPTTKLPESKSSLRTSPMISTSTNTPLEISPAASPKVQSNYSPPQSPMKSSSPNTHPSSFTFLKTPPGSPLKSPSSLSTSLKLPPESPPVSPLKAFPLSPPNSPKDKEPVVIEGLQMVQRTEVILRVNVCTTDAASQTEKDEELPQLTRRKLQEEIECEKLSQDLVKQLPPSDRLKELLVPDPDHKKPTDYVSGLFRPEITSQQRPGNSPFRSRNTTPNESPPPLLNSSSTSTSSKSSNPQTSIGSPLEPSSPLSPTSAYFTTSEPKAKFLTRYSQDMTPYNIKDTKELVQKKMELVNRLDRKLEVLRSEQLVVSEECRINDELGENVDIHINRLARPHEAAKFHLHVEEVGKITSLLLGLSGRLARAENAILGMSDDHPERRIMESKRDKLQDQLQEAKTLKENIDRRSVNVSNILYQYLNSEEYADYDHFINMKAKLILDAREISDKIKLGEEQLSALKETLSID